MFSSLSTWCNFGEKNMKKDVFNIVVAGVGGQGVLTIAAIIARTAMVSTSTSSAEITRPASSFQS